MTALAVAHLLAASSADAQVIDDVRPVVVEPGRTVTLVGRGFGDPFGKDVVMFRVVNGQMQGDVYPMPVMLWTPDRIKALAPSAIPQADVYGISIRGGGGIDLASWAGVRIGPMSLPRWPLQSGEVMHNRCERRPGDNGGRFDGCPMMSRIAGVDVSRAFPGGLLLVDGDFGNMQQGQLVALSRIDVRYTPELGRSIRRAFAQFHLPVLRWSPSRLELAIDEAVPPGTYMLAVVNRLDEFAADPVGMFEAGSNDVAVTIQRTWR